jgi:hypothetical protein
MPAMTPSRPETGILILVGIVLLELLVIIALGAAWAVLAARLRRKASRLGIELPNWPETNVQYMLSGATGFLPALDLDAAGTLLGRHAPQLLDKVRQLRRLHRALAVAMASVPVTVAIGWPLLA